MSRREKNLPEIKRSWLLSADPLAPCLQYLRRTKLRNRNSALLRCTHYLWNTCTPQPTRKKSLLGKAFSLTETQGMGRWAKSLLAGEIQKQTSQNISWYNLLHVSGIGNREIQKRRGDPFCVPDTHPELAAGIPRTTHSYLFPVTWSQNNPSVLRKLFFSIFFPLCLLILNHHKIRNS